MKKWKLYGISLVRSVLNWVSIYYASSKEKNLTWIIPSIMHVVKFIYYYREILSNVWIYICGMPFKIWHWFPNMYLKKNRRWNMLYLFLCCWIGYITGFNIMSSFADIFAKLH